MARKTLNAILEIVDDNKLLGRAWFTGLNSFEQARYQRDGNRNALDSEARRRRDNRRYLAEAEAEERRERAQRQREQAEKALRQHHARQRMASASEAMRRISGAR